MSHLTNKERIKIEHWLNEGRNFQGIADSVEKARSTIVREVWNASCPIWESFSENHSTTSPQSHSLKQFMERRS